MRAAPARLEHGIGWLSSSPNSVHPKFSAGRSQFTTTCEEIACMELSSSSLARTTNLDQCVHGVAQCAHGVGEVTPQQRPRHLHTATAILVGIQGSAAASLARPISPGPTGDAPRVDVMAPPAPPYALTCENSGDIITVPSETAEPGRSRSHVVKSNLSGRWGCGGRIGTNFSDFLLYFKTNKPFDVAAGRLPDDVDPMQATGMRLITRSFPISLVRALLPLPLPPFKPPLL